MFQRWVENLIQKDLRQRKSVVLLGSRRAGKTTLTKMLGEDNISYHTFDDVFLQDAIRKNPKYLEKLCNKNKINVLDEVQKAHSPFDTIKLLIDTGYLFILTGSSSLHILEQVSETLAGRIRIRYLHPRCWGEEISKLDSIPKRSILFNSENTPLDPIFFQKGKIDIQDALQYGGYPELHEKNNEEKKDLLRDYRNTYLQRDILEISNIQNLNGLRALLAALVQSIGSTVNYQNLARESGLSHITVKKYLNSLEQTFIIFKVFPYQYGQAKRYVKSPKWYFTDTGMLNSLNIRIGEGELFENFVISEVHKRLSVLNKDIDSLFFYKTVKGAEIDLVIDNKDQIHLYKIKSSQYPDKKFTRNIKNFISERTNLKDVNISGQVIYQGDVFTKHDNIQFTPIASWFGHP